MAQVLGDFIRYQLSSTRGESLGPNSHMYGMIFRAVESVSLPGSHTTVPTRFLTLGEQGLCSTYHCIARE